MPGHASAATPTQKELAKAVKRLNEPPGACVEPHEVTAPDWLNPHPEKASLALLKSKLHELTADRTQLEGSGLEVSIVKHSQEFERIRV